MKHIHVPQLFSLVITCALLVAPLPISAIAHDYTDTYVYLSEELSDINRIITSIKNLDDNENSLLAELHKHIKDGFLLGDYNAVVEALEYAEDVLQRNYNRLDDNQATQLWNDFEVLANQVLRGELTIDTKLKNDKKTIFNDDVSIEGFLSTGDATISTAGKVLKSATTETSTNTPNTIVLRNGYGSFSTQNINLDGNLNLKTNPSTTTTGNILKNGARFIHNAGTNNAFMGVNAGNFTLTGQQNVGVGVSALSGDTSGYENTAVGYRALIGNNTGFYNVAVGTDAMFGNRSGNSNTALGWNALVNGGGNNNIAIGLGAGTNVSGGSFNIYIGNTGAAEGNTIRIGTNGLQFRNFQAGIYGATINGGTATPVLIDASGQLGTTSSSRRYKHNIEDMGEDSANILELRPVTFAYNSDASETKQYGLIAEEVDEIFPGIVVRDADGQIETVQYHVLPVLLLNEMKKQQARLTEVERQQQITTEQMNTAIANLQAQIQQYIN